MNLFHKNNISSYNFYIVVCFIFCMSNGLYAQKEYTTISKNINPEAQNLYHDLSPQGDTLYLKAESIFYKVTFLNSLDRKVYKLNPPVLEAKIPLHDIIVGDYTVLVYKKDRIIVFHITRLLEIEKPSNELFQIDSAEEITITQAIPLNKPSLNKLPMNEVNMVENNEIIQLNMDELQLAMNDNTSHDPETDLIPEVRGYNLSSMDRSGMQSREEYRRNNLRPNGKPY